MTTEPIDLDAAQALMDAATPGSWMAYQESFVSSAEGPVAVITDRLPSDTPATADSEFIAQSRTLVPALIAELREERLRREAAEAMVAYQAELHAYHPSGGDQ